MRSPRSTPGSARWITRGAGLAWTVAILLMLGLAVRDRLPLVRHNHDVGHADEPAYALQARGLALQGSSKVPYVTGFFRRYDPGIWRHDDHWPPLLGWILAPFFKLFGVDAAVGRAVCVGIGAVALPGFVAILAGLACRRAWPAAAAAVLVLADTLLFRESLRILSDGLLTALLAGFVAALLAARLHHTRWFLAAGACAALATLSKGSQLVLLPWIPLGAVLLGGFRALKSRHPWYGVGIGLLLLLPWWITVWRAYDHPLHSTQNHVSAFYGIATDWDAGFYRIHWDESPPGLRDRFQDPAAWWRATRGNTEVFLRAAVLGDGAEPGDWAALGAPGRNIHQALTGGPVSTPVHPRRPPLPRPWKTVVQGLALVWGLFCLVAWPLERLVALRRTRRARRDPACSDSAEAVDNAPVFPIAVGACLMLMTLTQTLFVILLWSAEQIRFTLVLLPLLTVLGLQAIALVACGAVSVAIRCLRPIRPLERIVGSPRLRIARGLGSILLAASTMWAVTRVHSDLLEWQLAETRVRVHETPFFPVYHTLAQALAEAGVDETAIVMSRRPWQLLFYAPVGMRGVGLPHAAPEHILRVARYYGVTHVVFDQRRPGWSRFIRTHRRTFRPVIRRPYPVYELRQPAATP